jgi:hypothetical protein
MPVLVYTENAGGKFKKSIFEVVSYARAIADEQTTLTAISIGDVSADELAALGKYGADKVLNVSNDKLKNFVNQAYASIFAEAAKRRLLILLYYPTPSQVVVCPAYWVLSWTPVWPMAQYHCLIFRVESSALKKQPSRARLLLRLN